MKSTDDDHFLREVAHAQLMHREHCRQESAKRHDQLSITSEDLFPCEQYSAKRASEHLEREQERERLAALARQQLAEIAQEKADKKEDDAAFWKAVYIFIHVAAILVVVTTLYRVWGK